MFALFSLSINSSVRSLSGSGGGRTRWNRTIFRVWNKRGILADDTILAGKDRLVRAHCWNNHKSIEGMWCESQRLVTSFGLNTVYTGTCTLIILFVLRVLQQMRNVCSLGAKLCFILKVEYKTAANHKISELHLNNSCLFFF